MRSLRPILAVLPFLIAGCSTASHPPAEWVRQQGGLICDARQKRAEALMARLVDRTIDAHPRVYVLAADELSAHSWADRSVFLTRGLVDSLSDDELLAAMAHELGHLLGDGYLRSAVSLRGCAGGDGDCQDQEERADAIGLDLLRARHIPGQAMVSMLETVASEEDPASPCRRALDRRITLLSSRLDPP